MQESDIADKLKQQVPSAEEFTPAPPDDVPTQATTDLPDTIELSEITQFRLAQYFDEKLRDSDEVTKQQLKYIYEKISKISNSTDYGHIVEQIRYLERVIGISYHQNRLYKLYEWLKLDSMRSNIESQMGAIGDGYAGR